MKKVLVLLLVSVLGSVGALLFLKEMVKVLELEKALRWEKARVMVLQTELAKMKVPRLEKESVKEMELG